MARINIFFLGLLFLATHANSFTLKTLSVEPLEPELVSVSVSTKQDSEPNPILSTEPTDLITDHDVITNEIPSLPTIIVPETTEDVIVEQSLIERGDIAEEIPSVDELVINEKESPILGEESEHPETPVVPEFIVPEVIVDNPLPIEEINKNVETPLVHEELNIAEPTVHPSEPELFTYVESEPIDTIIDEEIVDFTPLLGSFVIPSIAERIPEPVHIEKELLFEHKLDKVIEPLVIPPAPELPPLVVPEIPPRVILEKEFIPHEGIYSILYEDKLKPCPPEVMHFKIPEYLSLPYYPIRKTVCDHFLYITHDHAINKV